MVKGIRYAAMKRFHAGRTGHGARQGLRVGRARERGLVVAVLIAVSGLVDPGHAPLIHEARAQSLFDSDRPSFEYDRRRRREEERRSRAQRKADYCRKLEQRLVSEWRRSNDTRSELPEIRKQMKEVEKKFRAAKAKAERARCYEESFFFGRSLRRTPKCVKLDRAVRRAQQEFEELKQRRDRVSRSGRGQSRQDELIAELARYGCGEDYERQYEERQPTFFSFFDDRGPRVREPRRRSRSELPFATYRTMCVRRCDGYYFPMSFSTLPSQFETDETQCHDKCAAPTALFVYKNPGENVEDMVSLDGVPYTDIDNAWLYRKTFVEGCSCDPEKFSLDKIAESRDAEQSSPLGGDRTSETAGEDSAKSKSGQSAGDGERAGTIWADQDADTARDTTERDSFDPRQR